MQIFVAHEYKNPPFLDYRSVFHLVGGQRKVDFVFGDDRHSSQLLFSELEEQIRHSDLCLFDVSTWNRNVILELGLARGFNRPHRLLFRPRPPSGWLFRRRTNYAEVPSDLEGVKRVQYFDAQSLQDRLNELISEHIDDADLSRTAIRLFDRVLTLVKRHPQGLSIASIADKLHLDPGVASAVVRGLRSEGKLVRQHTRYLAPSLPSLEREAIG